MILKVIVSSLSGILLLVGYLSFGRLLFLSERARRIPKTRQPKELYASLSDKGRSRIRLLKQQIASALDVDLPVGPSISNHGNNGVKKNEID